MATKKSPQKKAAPNNQKPLPSIEATIDRLLPTEGDGVRALATITLGGHYAFHGFKVYESEEKGLSVLCPATKSEKNHKYYENSHPITSEARADMNRAILDAYEQKLQEEQSEDLDEDQDEDLAQGQTM